MKAHPKIKVEIVGIYPEKHMKKVWATYHVYIPEKDMDIRGGKIFKKAKGFFVELPQSIGTCEETGKQIRFPTLSWPDKEYESLLRQSVVQAVKKELEKC